MLHRFDLHMHSWYSGDASSSPEALIASAQARGLSGIAITDHDTCAAHEYLAANPPPRGFLVVPGVEVSTAQGHLLCLGVTLPRMRGHDVREVFAAVQQAGGLAIPAHPFDKWRAGIRVQVLDSLELEVLETFNAAVSSRRFNADALSYATARGLRPLASSDAHHASAVGVSRIACDLQELTTPALLAALRKGATTESHYLSLREGMKKHFGNWFRAGNTKPPTALP